jgi:hypothetical protein
MPKDKGTITIITTSSPLDVRKSTFNVPNSLPHKLQFTNLIIHKTQDQQSPTIDYKKITDPHF